MLQNPLIGRHGSYTMGKRSDHSTFPRSLHRIMTTAQLRIIAKFRQVWKLIDWQEVSEIVWEGLKLTIATIIVCAMYSSEGTIKAYKWVAPRLANLLQHPAKTIKEGPDILYAESIESILKGQATVGERIVIRIASELQMIKDTFGEIKRRIRIIKRYSLSMI